MYKAFIFLAVVLTAQTVVAQESNTIKIHVQNKDTKQNIAEATVTLENTEIAVTNINGKAELKNIANGEQKIEIFSPGFETAELKLIFPLNDPTERTVFLENKNEMGEVTITSTRTGREIEAEPSRIEAIDEEEIDEKINMRPANVSMVLHESTGIQVQQTSATSNTQSVRIQGLDGRYTQILKDGFPAFGGFSGSLSILEIPPLDLKQVEVIKGPAATLFGGDAIAGVVNFVTKNPEVRPVTTFIFNQTSALGSDFSVFNSRKFTRFGYTLLASVNYQKQYDVDDDDFTELPNTKSFAMSPKLIFSIDKKTTLTVGNSTSYQNRKGGDTFVLSGNINNFHQYFEQNKSFRNVTTFNLNREFDDGSRLFVKQSFAFFNRELSTQNYAFRGRQFNSYTDVSYAKALGKHAVVFGGSAVRDQFRETSPNITFRPRNETRTTVGTFMQDTVDLTEKLSLEAGFRLDHSNNYGTFALPRVSVLYKFSDHLTTRIGFGLGYKTPTMFTEEAETLLFRNVSPVGNMFNAERSKGGTFDLNYRNIIGESFSYSVNQMFFYTDITDPLILRPDLNNIYRFANAASPVTSRGFETNARVSFGFAKLFLGYTFTDAKAGYLAGDRTLTLLPKHKINSSLVFERSGNYKTGAEFYYASPQTLDDRSLTPHTSEFGLFGEKTFGNYSLFINAENIFDQRQGRNGLVVYPPHQDPTFAELYMHTEGRIFNGGIKIRW